MTAVRLQKVLGSSALLLPPALLVLSALPATSAVLATAPVRAARASHARALPARTITLSETGHLHLTSKHGFTLNELGAGSGSIAATIYVHLTIVSTSRVTAEVNFYPAGGSISGQASASYRRGSEIGSFSGSLSINGGSGSYARARASGLSFSGTIARSNDAITVHVDGRVSD